MPIIIPERNLKPPPPQKKLRESLRLRMMHLADKLGSSAELARLMGVNKTQMSRYLNGTSVPRVEILAQLAKVFDLSIDWFFEDGDIEKDADESQFAIAVRNLVKERDFSIDDKFLPDGFYMFWKEMFSIDNAVEVLLGQVKTFGGIKKVKFSMIRDAKKHDYYDKMFFRDRYCESIMCKSAGNLSILTSDTENNLLMLGSMIRRKTANRLDSGILFHGVLYCPSGGDPGRRMLARTVLEHVPATTNQILNAARESGRRPMSEVPDRIMRFYDATVL